MENWLIVGLGNPGAAYERTRHNLGFMLVDLLARESQTQVKRDECRSLIGRGELENQRVELAKPQTFMNLSGESVKCLLQKPDRTVDETLRASEASTTEPSDWMILLPRTKEMPCWSSFQPIWQSSLDIRRCLCSCCM
jgi:hypothetical protein